MANNDGEVTGKHPGWPPALNERILSSMSRRSIAAHPSAEVGGGGAAVASALVRGRHAPPTAVEIGRASCRERV